MSDQSSFEGTELEAYVDARIEAALKKYQEQQKLKLGNLPLAELKRHLEQNWNPQSDTFILPHSVGPDSLAPVPGIVMRNTTTQSILNGTPTTVVYNTTDFKQGNITGNQGTGNVTIEVPGVYYVFGTVYFPSGATVPTIGGISRNGLHHSDQEAVRDEDTGGASGDVDWTANPSCFLRLIRGDTVQVHAYQLSGAAMNIGFVNPNNVQNKIGVVWHSALERRDT